MPTTTGVASASSGSPGATGGSSSTAATGSPSPSAAAPAASTKGVTTKDCTSVMDYLHMSLPRKDLLDLYFDESYGQYVCQSVFQRLPQISQQIIVRLACTGDGSFPLPHTIMWFKPRPLPNIPVTTMSGNTKIFTPDEATLKFKQSVKRIMEELYQWAIIERDLSQDIENVFDDSQNPNNNGGGSGDAPSRPVVDVKLTKQFMTGYRDCITSLDVSPWQPMTESQIEEVELGYYEQQKKNAEKNRTAAPREMEKLPRLTLYQLEEHTTSQWDMVLHFLVGSDKSSSPSISVIHFLLTTGLMQYDPDYKGRQPEKYADLVITTSGYDFMLKDNSQQIWHFVLEYLNQIIEIQDDRSPEEKKANQREALLFLVSLSCCRVGDCFPTTKLTKTQRIVAKNLSSFGLLYWWGDRKYGAFYPTRVALQLVGGTGGTSSSSSGSNRDGGGMWSWSTKTLDSALAHPHPNDSGHLAIIVQTNFQVCAYTTSDLHVSMLGLFCDVSTIRRLPNVVMMMISRDSIKAAFALGIKASQILRFLEKHAHPKLREGTASPLPSNVVDQVNLWDNEQRRVQWEEVYVIKTSMDGEFEYAVKLAKELKILAYSNSTKRTLMVKHRGAKVMVKRIGNWRARKAAIL